MSNFFLSIFAYSLGCVLLFAVIGVILEIYLDSFGDQVALFLLKLSALTAVISGFAWIIALLFGWGHSLYQGLLK